MDINKENVELARHNAGVYGVRDYINFMEGDFFNLESQHLNAFESDPVWYESLFFLIIIIIVIIIEFLVLTMVCYEGRRCVPESALGGSHL